MCCALRLEEQCFVPSAASAQLLWLRQLAQMLLGSKMAAATAALVCTG
jgi:hypothetical protein